MRVSWGRKRQLLDGVERRKKGTMEQKKRGDGEPFGRGGSLGGGDTSSGWARNHRLCAKPHAGKQGQSQVRVRRCPELDASSWRPCRDTAVQNYMYEYTVDPTVVQNHVVILPWCQITWWILQYGAS